MAHPYHLALHGVDIALPDGRILFQDIHDSFKAETVALIGPNGSGKSSFGRVVAGLAQPARGRIERVVPSRYVEQQTGPTFAASLAQLAGLDAPLDALRRLAAGDARDDDFDLIGERWDLEARWQAMLDSEAQRNVRGCWNHTIDPTRVPPKKEQRRAGHVLAGQAVRLPASCCGHSRGVNIRGSRTCPYEGLYHWTEPR